MINGTDSIGQRRSIELRRENMEQSDGSSDLSNSIVNNSYIVIDVLLYEQHKYHLIKQV